MVRSSGFIRSYKAFLWLSAVGVGLAVSSHAPAQQSESQGDTGVSHDEILWHAGDIDSAFAAARAARKPVLLYWGADWCPPCSRLKATVFRRPEFVERTRQFVAVDLDGDEPGAQRLGEEFGVYGYPTVIVLTPDREEITRISIALEMEQYVRALDVALTASRPASAAYAAVLSGIATDSDLRLLGYYSWDQDKERLVAESQLPATLKALEATYPPHLAVEQSRLFMAYLATRALADWGDEGAPALTGEELRWARGRLQMILQDPAQVQANFLDVLYGAHWMYALLAEPADADADALADVWEETLAGIREDPGTSAVNRIRTLYGTLCLLAARQPDQAPPDRLVQAVRRAVREADRATEDTYTRMDLFSAAYGALSVAWLYDEAYDFMTREVERSHSPDYIMLALADWAQWEGLPSEALSWARRAWQEAHGPATRFERGTRYIHMLVQLAPDARVPIEDTAIALFRDASEAQDAFFLRTTRYMRRLETHLLEWNVAGVRAPSVARIRAEVMAICDSIAEDGPSRTTCRTFLAEQSPAVPPI